LVFCPTIIDKVIDSKFSWTEVNVNGITMAREGVGLSEMGNFCKWRDI
jgi:hypothetical protein